MLSHRLNDTFRVLTAVSVILLPLTLIASIFGMNMPVPGEGSHAGFFAVVGVMVVVLVATIVLFKPPRLALTPRTPRRAAGLAGRGPAALRDAWFRQQRGGMALPGQ